MNRSRSIFLDKTVTVFIRIKIMLTSKVYCERDLGKPGRDPRSGVSSEAGRAHLLIVSQVAT